MKQLHLIIHGKVQGVFFRETTKEKAQELGLFGYVKNMSNGTVEVVVEGDEERLKKLLKWCKIGTQYAKVDKVVEEWDDAVEVSFKDFRIV
ncbi:MAG TPA: acylphosphatase [Candidatus Magasanikbacteria bacterium]|nr:MAG: hypothetical protein A2479_02900 [Candidatus Magasanikbacteria bacterium RIFOXYC2_FULL_39_8]HAT03772.1 acylphosphatase [Candidatus Magasanikbacteria bacterium]